MKTESTQKVELAAHGMHKGQRAKIGGKRVVITRVKQDTVWHRPESLKERFGHLLGRLRAACQRPRVS